MDIQLDGKVVQVLPEQRGSGKNGEWVKNSFVLEYSDGGYMSKLCLEVYDAEKWEKMKSCAVVGADVHVRFSVSSREWNRKWFTTARCFYCSASGIQQQQLQSAPVQSPVPNAQPAPAVSSAPSKSDDLPF